MQSLKRQLSFSKFLQLSLLIIFLFSGKTILSQSPVFKNYTPFDDLPSSETYYSFQDSKGYMWFATDRGIAKFDGYNFKVFTTADGLPDNTVFELFQGKNDEIWFKTFSSEIGYIRNDSIFSYRHSDKIKAILPLHILSYIVFDQNGDVFFTKNPVENSLDTKIYKIDTAGKIDSISYVSTPGIKKIYVGQYGQRLVLSDYPSHTTEVYRYETGQKLFSIPAQYCDVKTFIAPIQTTGDFFIYTDGQVFSVVNNKSTKVFECDSDMIYLFVDNDSDLWLGHYLRGVERYTYKSGYKAAQWELKNHSVSSINQDWEGGMWFTTLENGIYYLPPVSPPAYTQAHGLPIANVKQIKKIDDNILFMLSDNTLLLKNITSDEFTKLKESTTAYFDLGYDSGKIFMGTSVQVSPILNKKMINIWHVRKMHIGTQYVWAHASSYIRKFSKNGDLLLQIYPSSIPRIITMYEIKSGGLLIGTTRGLYLYNGDSITSLKKYGHEYNYRVSDIKRFNDKYLVVATMGQGVFIVDETDYSVLAHYTIAHGLPSGMCNVVVADGHALWVGTNRGLGRITHTLDKQKAKIVTVNIFDGLVSNEINDICIINNHLWLATSKGVSIVAKNSLSGKLRDIPVYIENININGNLSLPRKNLSISHKQNNVTISFIGLHFQHAGRLVYRYRMKGRDKSWYFTTSRSVVYNSLSPGTYTFEVGVIKPNGEENPGIAQYSFTIQPPFWQTWWFIILLIVAGSVAVYLFMYYRIRFIHRQVQLKNDLNSFRDKALRNQMNPHFIYNSLNSIQNFILKNNAMDSAGFLSKFSQLMRLTFNNTGQERVPLDKDLEALQLYAELENLRFHDKFTLHIEHNLGSAAARITIPPLILQPFVENAILHGLLTKKGQGNIWIEILGENNVLAITITDDGIGREQAAKIQERKQRFKTTLAKNKTKSSGIAATLARIEQAWGKTPQKSEFEIVDLRNESNLFSGTSVHFCLPVTHD